ncbi:MAG: SPOR domain-containing protein [Alphaproteobacteria bacterium]|nr:SPOR domain-containing protein [Alphaproteobacteria bacterium]
MTHPRHPSFGGTFLGLVIGLVLGLLVALGVAIYVSKVPVPFMNKGANRGADPSAADTEKNKDWDPNAPLYGKNPVKPTEKPQEDGAKTNPVLAPPAVVGMPQDNKSEDPLGDLARERANAPDPFQYYVQVGAFRSAEEAEGLRAKLSLAGYDPKVTVREVTGRQLHRVRIGPIESKSEAEEVQQKLNAAKMASALVRVQR